MDGKIETGETKNDHQQFASLALVWRRRAIRAGGAHYRASEYHALVGKALSVFNILSAIAVLFLTNNKFFTAEALSGTEFAATAMPSIWRNVDFWTAIAGLVIVLTTVLQYILRPEVKEIEAKRAGADFTQIKREIEVLLASGRIEKSSLDRLQVAHSHTSKNHSLVPARLWRKAENNTNRAIREDFEFEKSVCSRFELDPSSIERM